MGTQASGLAKSPDVDHRFPRRAGFCTSIVGGILGSLSPMFLFPPEPTKGRLFFLAALLLSGSAQASTLFFEDFEGNPFDQYELRDLSGAPFGFGDLLSDSRYFLRTTDPDLEDSLDQPILNTTGNFIALSDVSALPSGLGLMVFDPINIIGASDLLVSLSVAAPEPSSGAYEESDFLKLQYSYDGTNFSDAISLSGNDINAGLHLNGIPAQGTAARTFSEFSAAIPSGVGDNLMLRLAFSSDNREPIAFDNFEVSGSTIPEPSGTALLAMTVSAICCFRRRR